MSFCSYTNMRKRSTTLSNHNALNFKIPLNSRENWELIAMKRIDQYVYLPAIFEMELVAYPYILCILSSFKGAQTWSAEGTKHFIDIEEQKIYEILRLHKPA